MQDGKVMWINLKLEQEINGIEFYATVSRQKISAGRFFFGGGAEIGYVFGSCQLSRNIFGGGGSDGAGLRF